MHATRRRNAADIDRQQATNTRGHYQAASASRPLIFGPTQSHPSVISRFQNGRACDFRYPRTWLPKPSLRCRRSRATILSNLAASTVDRTAEYQGHRPSENSAIAFAISGRGRSVMPGSQSSIASAITGKNPARFPVNVNKSAISRDRERTPHFCPIERASDRDFHPSPCHGGKKATSRTPSTTPVKTSLLIHCHPKPYENRKPDSIAFLAGAQFVRPLCDSAGQLSHLLGKTRCGSRTHEIQDNSSAGSTNGAGICGKGNHSRDRRRAAGNPKGTSPTPRLNHPWNFHVSAQNVLSSSPKE